MQVRVSDMKGFRQLLRETGASVQIAGGAVRYGQGADIFYVFADDCRITFGMDDDNEINVVCIAPVDNSEVQRKTAWLAAAMAELLMVSGQ